MLLDENNLRLVGHLRDEAAALVAPLQESIRTVWRGGAAPAARGSRPSPRRLAIPPVRIRAGV